MEPIFFSNALVLTEFLGSGGICKKILHFDVSRGLRSQKTPFLSHFTREFGQKLRAIALGGPTTPKSKISSQIIYKCTKPLIPSVKFRGHRTFFPCNKSRLKWRNWDQLLTEYMVVSKPKFADNICTVYWYWNYILIQKLTLAHNVVGGSCELKSFVV